MEAAALVKAALLGTALAPGNAPVGVPLDALVEGAQPETPERRLLLAAGAAAVYRMAGRAAVAGEPPPPAAPEETQAESSPAVASIFASLFAGERRELLLPEACSRLAAAGRRLPFALLPSALSQSDTSQREALRPLLGERGRWLAGFNPDWAWARAPRPGAEDRPAGEDERIWEEGSFDDRLELLKRLRATDPDRAREWLRPVFSKEKADLRGALVMVLGTGLAAPDEPFLEDVLNDRSAAVRAVAAVLLARLPGSALAKRMRDRADALLSWEAPRTGMLARLTSALGAGRGKLQAEPPQEIDKSWERDGVATAPPQGVGKRAFWLRESLSLVPPGHWTQRFDTSPADLLVAASATDWAGPLVEGWARAALRFQSREWAVALWDHGRKDKGTAQTSELRPLLPEILSLLPPGEMVARITPLLAAPPPREEAPFQVYLNRLPSPWPPDFAAAWLKAVRQFVRALPDKPVEDPWQATLPRAALSLPPECFATALEPWPLAEPAPGEWQRRGWAQQIDQLTQVVRIRQTLWKESMT